jgi:hypothetical protein
MLSAKNRDTAARCRHYAMCKIDFLGTGICPAGLEHHYVSYYPQGRMDIYRALADAIIPITLRLIDIAQTCNLCGICDRQCHFVTALRPLGVMQGLREYVDGYVAGGGPIDDPPEDDVLKELRSITGEQWATNDPAILVTYADDPFPLKGMQMPAYVVLPGTRGEVARIVRMAVRGSIPYAIRGNGGSVFGFVFTDGIVIDLNRMKRVKIDTENWTATVEPGVTSFELQQEASKAGCRVNTAEPAATVCGNIVCTGMFSTWSNAYGVAADNLVNAEFVDRTGKFFDLNNKGSPNLFAFANEVLEPPGICTAAVVRMYPMTDDEEGLFVPFSSFDEAVVFARDLAQRRIGIALAVIGGHYLSTFISPSTELAAGVRMTLQDMMGIRYAVAVVCDSYAARAIREMTGNTVIDNRLFKMLMLGLPALEGGEWVELLRDLESDRSRPLYELLCKDEILPVLEAVLRPTPAAAASVVDEDLRTFYEDLYSRPEMTDARWLTMFRIVSSRMSRHRHMFAFLIYVPLDRPAVIRGIIDEFARFAGEQGISHDYGFLTPVDFGKRAVLEYDYYIDHTDPEEKQKIARAMLRVEPWLDRLSSETRGVKSLKYIFAQGCCRKETFLYL